MLLQQRYRGGRISHRKAGAGLTLSVIVLALLAAPSFVHAVVVPQARVVAQDSGSFESTETELFVSNQSDQTAPAFDFSLFVVASNGFFPTAPANWVAQDIGGASAWDQSMGGPTTGLPTWHQYTGLAYEVAYPTGPNKVLGFFLNYSYDSQTGRVALAHPSPSHPVPRCGGFSYWASRLLS